MTTGSREAGTREVRTFGATLFGAAAILAFIARRRGFPMGTSTAAGSFALIGIFAIVAPRLARPIQRAWMRIGHLLGLVTTPIVLTLVFLFVLTPARLLLSAFGRDPLSRRRDRALSTYWQDRSHRTFGRDDFERLS